MSTTGGTPQGTVRLLDPPDVIRKKFKSAVTDSGREVRRGDDKPGVTNLIDIMSVATGEAPDAIEARYDGAGLRPVQDRRRRGGVALFEPIQARYAELRAGPGRAPAAARARRGEGRRGVGADARGDVRAHGLRHGRAQTARTGASRAREPASTSAASSSRHVPGSRPSTVETGVAAAVQPAHRVADRLAHPPHLAVAALVEHELEARRGRAGARGRARSARRRARRRRRAAPAPR